MTIDYKKIITETIDDEIILKKLVNYIIENDISIETEDELRYTIEDFLYDIILPNSPENLEILDWSIDTEKYRYLIDDSNYKEPTYTCCDDFSNYNYCPICGTKLN